MTNHLKLNECRRPYYKLSGEFPVHALFALQELTHSSSVLKFAGLVLVASVWLLLKKPTAWRISPQYQETGMIRLHMVSETEWVTKGQGVHTAFIELMALLAEEPAVSIVVNDEGNGDIFHSHTYGPYYFWKSRKYKGRRILTAHVIPDSSRGAIPFWKQLLPVTTWYLKLAYNNADVVIAISPTVESTLKKLGVKSKIVRINNPVLINRWRRTEANRVKGRELLGIAEHESVVIGVGQLQQRKGVEDFIDVAASFPDVRFVWVGGRPWGRFTEGIERIDARIESAPSNVQFAGLLELDDMAPMYAAGDVFLFPSYQENCPLAPLEAAAAGLPVVFRDLVEYQRLFPSPYLKADSTDQFIHITRRLLTDDQYYGQGVNFSRQLLEEFAKETVKSKLLALYRDTLNKNRDTNVGS